MNNKEFKSTIKELRKVAKNNSNYKKNDFFARWLKEFATDLTDQQYRKYIHNQYVWHAFNYNLIPKEMYLEGDDARQAYDKANKDGAVCLQLDFEDKPIVLTEEFETAEKIEFYNEFYVIGKDFSWTYIVTHETEIGIGPYFMQNLRSKSD